MIKQLRRGEYFGNILQRKECDGFVVTTTFHPASSFTPVHVHEQPYLCFIFKGAFSEKASSLETFCKKNDLIVHPVNIEHQDDFDKAGAKCLNIEIGTKWIEKFKEYKINFTKYRLIKDANCTLVMNKILDELNTPDLVSSLCIEALFIEIVCRSIKVKTNSTYPYIGRIQEFIAANLNRHIPMTDIAQVTDLHPVYMSAIFKKHTGYTIGEYARKARVAKAIELLLHTKKDLLEISMDCGFADQSHLCKTFKNATSVTPTQFRKNNL